MKQCSSCGGDCRGKCERENIKGCTMNCSPTKSEKRTAHERQNECDECHTMPVNHQDIIACLRDLAKQNYEYRSILEEAATLLDDFRINSKALYMYCDARMMAGDIYSLQCLRALVKRMESDRMPNHKYLYGS